MRLQMRLSARNVSIERSLFEAGPGAMLSGESSIEMHALDVGKLDILSIAA